MPDIINLLPDSVANQIAAGEVIQRPASVIKELIENAVDAEADEILVWIKDAGKTLIQVTDNGKGMSPTDARMSFERHATSKIKKADDLFSIHTKGFRGEALASIAAIAHVELKTRARDNEIGTTVIIEGSEVKRQEPTACSQGSSFFVKNLFYNVPARRNFLKSDAVETSHIIDEFQRVALAHPDIKFTLINNNNEVYKLEKQTLRQRIVSVFGKNYNEKLVPVEESTDYIKIKGFVSKPEYARKTRGEQFFFINHRFIKSTYLNHAVVKAFEQLLQPDTFPSYFIYLEMLPHTIDINIHPTKTEIKFEDEKTIYAILRSAVKRSLGVYNITPTIDFDVEQTVNISPPKPGEPIKVPTIRIKEGYNPFNNPEAHNAIKNARSYDDWQSPLAASFIETEKISTGDGSVNTQANTEAEQEVVQASMMSSDTDEVGSELPITSNFQIHKSYILSHLKTGVVIIDQQGAHERILFEKYMKELTQQKSYSQQLLFPVMLEFPLNESTRLNDMLPDLHQLGFDISVMGKNTFNINGIPPEMKETEIKETIEKILEETKQYSNLSTGKKEILAKILAKNSAIKRGQVLSNEEMQHIIDQLFSCEQSYYSPGGKLTLITITLEELEKRFKS
ncbi:MAG: DNA mismatch repair endonuclease MutL [Bacteroidia bacterium]|nr:DNA mismatch repair endonuclease MutL [Bacteroidia bacterium]MCZ2247961.1 DNA mismatch repair endonuclease MutL [Bacteroidia bacterium]